jgi:hypothetical protein
VKSLDKHKPEILQRIAALTPDSARRWGRMSCHQMIVHLTDSFLCPIGERPASPMKPPIPRSVMKWGALYLPMKWPRGVPTRPEMKQGVGGSAPIEFSRDRKKLVHLIGRFTTDRFAWSEHPIFGPMSQKDWMRWGYLHCDHHLRQFGV